MTLNPLVTTSLKTIQLICKPNQLTDCLYMTGTLVVNRLNVLGHMSNIFKRKNYLLRTTSYKLSVVKVVITAIITE